MTLIVFKKINNKIIIKSDTLIKGPDQKNINDNLYYGLKVFFLGKKYIIAYSGTQDYAHQIIYNINSQLDKFNNIQSIGNYILNIKSSIQNNDSNFYNNFPDFIIASTKINEPFIEVKENNPIKENNFTSWIGDINGFKLFQDHFINNNLTDLEKKFDNAFEKVLESPSIDTVGGQNIKIIGDMYGFTYQQEFSLTSPNYFLKPSLISDIEGNTFTTVQWGDASTGGFGYTTIVPEEKFINGYGIYYFQGKFGFYFYIDISKGIAERLRCKAINVYEFVSIIEKEVGYKLLHCGSLNN